MLETPNESNKPDQIDNPDQVDTPDQADTQADADNMPEDQPESEDEARDEGPDKPTHTDDDPKDAPPASSPPAAKPFDGRPNEINEGDPIRQDGMDWFVFRVASNKESSVQNTLLRKVQIENMTHLVGRILVPTEKIKTIKGGKQRIKEEKLYPGYVFVEMQLEEDGRIPQDVFFLIKETTGVGDFVGTAGRPTPMAQHEVEKMQQDARAPDEEPVIRMTFEKGEAVTIKEGPFENYEGTVDELLPEKGLVRVLVTIFGRQAPIELEEWQIAKSDET